MANEQIAGNIILVIDDDEINLQMAKMILERALPCRVLTCDNGIQGIEIMKRQYVRLVLLDIVMPFFDGIQTLQRIREDPNIKDMPVIMLTASVDKQNVSKAIKLGVKDYLRKPFMPDELVKRVVKKLGPLATNAKSTILLIEDNELERNRLKTLIEETLPHEVIVAPSSIDGLEALRNRKIDLVIASVEMPFINGFRIVDFMRGDAALSSIPTFLITSSNDPAVLKKIENYSVKGYLHKPVANYEGLAPLVNYLKAR